MTLRKKLLVGVAGLAVALVLALLLLPALLRGPVEARAHAEIEKAVAARVEWSGVGLTFFRDFPNLTLDLDDLAVLGVDAFAGDTLVAMERFSLVLDLGTVWRSLRGNGAVLVRSVQLAHPAVHLRVLDDGSANWDIARGGADPASEPGSEPASGAAPAAAPAAAQAMSLELRDFSVTDGTLVMEDARSGLFVSLTGLQHTLAGDFSQDRFVVRTRTQADAATVRFAGLPYLERTALDFRADLDADMANKRFTFADNELRLNDLQVGFSGSAASVGDNVALDVTFQAPRTDFAQVLSLVPVVYAHDFATLQTSGSFTLAGNVTGEWGENAFPAFTLAADVADGMFRYPDLPLPARDISLHLAVDNPGGDVDNTVVRLERAHVQLGDQVVHAALTLRTPVSDPDVDLSVEGTVDLADVARTVKLPDVQELTGTVQADATVRARLSDVDAKRWERVAARGTVSARDVAVRSATLAQPVSVQEATLVLSPQRAELRSLQAMLGSSDVRASGSLDNVLAYVLRGDALQGRATFASHHVNLDEWKSDSELQAIPVPAGFDMALSGTVDSLTYGVLRMSDARGGLMLKDQRVTLDDFTLRTLGGRIAMNGFYDTVDPARPLFNVDVALDSLDIPGSSAAFLTVRALAPVARFARGTFSAALKLDGALGSGMEPIFDALSGSGSLQTTPLTLEGFPAMARLSDALKLPQLANPTLNAIRSTLEIKDGRLHVKPFSVGVGDFRLGVTGSNGVDGSMDYALSLAVPRALLGGAADQAVRGLISQAGRVGVNLEAADSVEVSVTLGGTVTDPSVQTAFGRAVGSAGDQARQAVGTAVGNQLAGAEERLDVERARVDSTADAARARAQAQADSIIQAAETQAAAIRAEARKLADDALAEANRRADALVAEATNPVARVAARAAADRLKKEADQRGAAMVQEAARRAEQLVAEARARADALVREG